MRLFKANLLLDSTEHLDLSYIAKRNYKLIIFDMNNTIIDYYTTNIPKKIKELIANLKKKNITVYILTNSFSNKQVESIAKILDVKYIKNAFKPLPFSVNKIIKKEKVKKNEVLMIGDHLFTDILNANICKIDSILVSPLNKKEKIHSKLIRNIENIILKKQKL